MKEKKPTPAIVERKGKVCKSYCGKNAAENKIMADGAEKEKDSKAVIEEDDNVRV